MASNEKNYSEVKQKKFEFEISSKPVEFSQFLIIQKNNIHFLIPNYIRPDLPEIIKKYKALFELQGEFNGEFKMMSPVFMDYVGFGIWRFRNPGKITFSQASIAEENKEGIKRFNHFRPEFLHLAPSQQQRGYQTLLRAVQELIVPFRPNRSEPRVVKRRLKPFPRMQEPRSVLKAKLVA